MNSSIGLLALAAIIAINTLAAPSGDQSGPMFREADDRLDEKPTETTKAIDERVKQQVRANATHGSAKASERLMRELRDLRKSESYKQGIIDVELVNDYLYEWNVKLRFPEPNSHLHDDLKQLKEEGKGKDHILLRVTFKDDYPSSPPFVRIVYPLLNHNLLLLDGGVLCHEMLSSGSWKSDYTMEGVILVHADVLARGGTKVAALNNYLRCADFSDEIARENFKLVDKQYSKYKSWPKTV